MTKLSGAMHISPVTTDELRFLTYVQHMAETAQSDAARHMFQEYMQLEKRRLAATGARGIQARPASQMPAMED
jgi:hypothetical protein